MGEVVNVRIIVRGPEDRRVEHVAEIAGQDELHHAIGVALGMYDNFYPDAPPFRKTVEIDPAWKAPHLSEIEEFS